MADVQLTQEEQAQYAQILIDAKGVIDDSLKNVLENTFGSSKGFELYEITSNTKALILSSAISWDNNKTIGENIAHIAGDNIVDVIIGAAGFVGFEAFIIGYAVDKGLNLVGIDLGDITEKAYQQAQYVSNINDIETANYNNLPEEVKATMMSQGKYPGGPNWNEFLNEMVDSQSKILTKEINNTYYSNLATETTNSNQYTKNNILDLEYHINKNYIDGLIDNTVYQNISENFSNYYLQSLPSYTPYTDYYFTPIDIGAFYESNTSQEDNSTTIADKTFRILDSQNQAISKEQLELLDVNADGKLDENEITTLKTWKDINEDGIAEEVSFIKSKNTIRFYQANLKKVA